MPKLLVWRDDLLPLSETFVRNQADSLTTYETFMCGANSVPSTLRRTNDIVLFDGGRFDGTRRRILDRFGVSLRLRKVIRSSNAQLIQAHFLWGGVSVARSAKRLGVPLIVNLHGADVTARDVRSGLTRREMDLARYASLFLCTSNFIRDTALRLGLPEEKLSTHYIGIPVPPPTKALDAKKWDIVFIGRIEPKKGLSDLLMAVFELARHGNRLRVAVVGSGSEAEICKRLALESGLDVTFFGALNSSEVSHILGRSRIFVGPSRTALNGDSEGLGMVFLEASAHGLPVVAYAHGGVPEAVVDGETGVLVREGQVGDLAEAIRVLYEDDQLCDKLGQQGRVHVEKNFFLETQAEALGKIFDRVIAAG